jgi:hypothetical protein
MTPFQERWADLAKRLGLSVKIPFVVSTSGGNLSVPVLLEKFGAERGMLLLTEWTKLVAYEQEVVDLGYGYSCLSEDWDAEDEDDELALADMLMDWGWSGHDAPPTAVMTLFRKVESRSKIEVPSSPVSGRKVGVDSKRRRDGRHCPVCLAPLRKNIRRTRLRRECLACGAHPQREKSCRRCVASGGAVWEGPAGAACTTCGLHGPKQEVAVSVLK